MRFLRVPLMVAVAVCALCVAFVPAASADGVYFSSPASDNTYVNSSADIPSFAWAFIGEIGYGDCAFERVAPSASVLADTDCFTGTSAPTADLSMAPASTSFTWNIASLVSGDGTYKVSGYAVFTSIGATNFSQTFTLDTVDPAVTLDSPTGWTNDNTPAVSFVVYDANLDTSYCAVDPVDSSDLGEYQACTSGSSLPAVEDGTHELWVLHKDLAGNVGSAHKTFQVDTTPPQITVTGLASGEVMTNAYPSAAVTAADGGSGMNFLSCAWDSNALGSCTNPDFTMALLADGAHILHVTAIDQLGNTSTVAMPFSVDTTGGIKQGLIAPKSGTYKLKRGKLKGSVYASTIVTTFAIPQGGDAKACSGTAATRVLLKKKQLGSAKVKFKVVGGKCTATSGVKLSKTFKGKKLTVILDYKNGPIKAFRVSGTVKF